MEDISELFAVDAEELLLNNKIEDALELCRKGISIFPDYPFAFSLLANIYEQRGDLYEAISTIENASLQFPFYKPFSSIKNRLEEKIFSEQKEFAPDSAPVSLEALSTPPDIPDEYGELPEYISDNEPGSDNTDNLINTNNSETSFEFIAVKEIPGTFPGDYGFLKFVSNIELDTERCELRASNLKLIPGLEFTPLYAKGQRNKSVNHIKSLHPFPDFNIRLKKTAEEQTSKGNKKPIQMSGIPKENIEQSKSGSEQNPFEMTETIAKIYEQQGAYDAAVKGYYELAELYPEKSEYFKLKAESIKSRNKN